MIAVVTFCDVFARYVFSAPFTFTVELTEISMALIVFLGVGLVTHDDGHINVDVVTLRLSERRARCSSLVTNMLALRIPGHSWSGGSGCRPCLPAWQGRQDADLG